MRGQKEADWGDSCRLSSWKSFPKRGDGSHLDWGLGVGGIRWSLRPGINGKGRETSGEFSARPWWARPVVGYHGTGRKSLHLWTVTCSCSRSYCLANFQAPAEIGKALWDTAVVLQNGAILLWECDEARGVPKLRLHGNWPRRTLLLLTSVNGVSALALLLIYRCVCISPC